MQGLLKNPMADGSTMGVSSGASLGAVLYLTFGFNLPFFNNYSLMFFAIIYAFLSLILIIFLTYKIDSSLSTNTLILIGIIFSMFMNALITLCISIAGSRANSITFWTLGSLSGADYNDVILIFFVFVISFVFISLKHKELNAFAIGEENAAHVGINVKSTKIQLLIIISILIGVCVSIGGTIAFIGLVTPHIARFIVGANYKKILSASVVLGGNILLIADLLSRILIRPQELPVGVITSIFGAIIFIFVIFSQNRRNR